MAEHDEIPLTTYAFVIDGEAVFTMNIPIDNEHLNAILSSNPTIVKLEDDIVPDIVAGIMTGNYVQIRQSGSSQ